MSRPELTVVGTGYAVAGQVTLETEAAIRAADRLFYLVTDPATAAFLRRLNPRAWSLHDAYQAGERGLAASRAMVERILEPLGRELSVCAAFSGHPAVFLHTSHAAVLEARQRGFAARMLPAVSCEDGLVADLGVDSSRSGRFLFEATDFLLRRRRFDPGGALVLLQVGAIGLLDYREGAEPNRRGLEVLAQVLQACYPPGHQAVLYEIPLLPLFDPTILPVALADLPRAPVTVVSTLYVPPSPPPGGSPTPPPGGSPTPPPG